ncbi:MAG: reverse transcriptase N-terminal domain-containing protein, partial [Trichodesmium sp. St2_bin2_1]|nr:reverse transcriptase N-terminal domain-containing protein [Trichodesmium sp. St2_bin2_1]
MKKAKTLKRKPCNPKPFLSVVWDTDDRPSQVNVNPNLKWKNINWKRALKNVFKLQKLIYRASSRGDIRKMRKYQRLLIKSYYPRLLAIRAVTQDNQRRKTVGVDGMKNLPPMQRFNLVDLLNVLHLKDIPTPELPMPKPSKDEKRSLGIPRMYDRALQALVKLGRSPEWEARFEPNSYGFWPGQST